MKDGRKIPPEYVALIKRLMVLIQQWCGEQPALPDLKWLDPGDTVFIGGLAGKALDFLCDSPDARRLCEWLDEQTNRQATVFQMTMALRFLGHLPGGPDAELKKRLIASPCPTCGKSLDGASNPSGAMPSPGDFSVCVYCAGFARYDERLALRACSADELDELEPEARAGLETAQDAIRTAVLRARQSRMVQS
jgi:hypothetical protein